MEGEVPRAWLRIRLEARPDSTLALAAVDHSGRVLRVPTRTSFVPTELFEFEELFVEGLGPVPVIVPTSLTQLLNALFSLLPLSRSDLSATGEVPLAVYVTPPEGLTALPFESAVGDLLRRRTSRRVMVVLERPPVAPAPPFELPLDLCLVGETGATFVARLRADRTWILDDPAVDEVTTLTFAEDGAEIMRLMRSGLNPDVVVIAVWGAAGLELIDSAPSPRLAIVFTTPTVRPPILPVDSSLARSVVYVNDSPAGFDLAAEIFAGLSHDRPIHEAVAIADERHPGALVRVLSSPPANQDLRLTDAVEAVVVAGRDLGRRYGLGRVESWTGPPLVLGDVLGDLHALDVDFGRETTGLWPLARAKASLAAAIDAVANMSVRRGSDQRPPRRVVDIAIRRGTEVQSAGGPTVYVTKDTSLVRGGEYVLEVQIGGGSVDTLLDEPPPPVDLLLPDRSEGHILDVSVVGRGVGFAVPSSRQLHLPPRGASDTVGFPFVVDGPLNAGAWARISLHHESRLVQTFRLEARVTAREEQTYGTESVVVRLQHNETAAWQNLDELAPRALSILLNQSPAGSHQLVVNKGSTVDDIDLDVSTQAGIADAMRQVLVTVIDPSRARGAVGAVRKLSEQGVALYSGIFNRLGDPGRSVFRSLLKTGDQLIQIVRVDAQQVVPWALAYDWDPPGDFDSATVCFGKDVGGVACTHGSDAGGSDVVCVRGFWGIRHRVEEIVARLRTRDLPAAITVSAAAPVVAVGIGTANSYTSAIPTDLANQLGSGAVAVLTPNDRLFDLLWDDTRRPGLVLIVGHHKTKNAPGEPKGPRIATGTADPWLREQDITTRAKNAGDWGPPHALVLLIACDSASVDARDLTSYILALDAAGAAGVIGTECEVKSDLAQSFAVRFLTTLVNGLPGGSSSPTLAESLQNVRRRYVIEEEDVRGFAFTAFGTADAHVVRV